MQVLTTIEELRKAKSAVPGSWGLVPTMGYLHEGHLSLVKRARAENDHVAVSIFVNPAQFGPNEDLAAYPHDLDRDLSLLEPLGVDLVFNPSPEVMYPANYQTYVNVEEVTKYLEGASRPGHFRGVATVVLKLFNILQPDRAYFGEKDPQQLAIIRRMVRDLNLTVEIVPVATARDSDGLALSSRNKHLSLDERRVAPILFQALLVAQGLIATGTTDPAEVKAAASAMVQVDARNARAASTALAPSPPARSPSLSGRSRSASSARGSPAG